MRPDAALREIDPMSQKAPKLPNRQTPFSDAFVSFIATDWEPYPSELPAPLPASAHTAARRDAVSAAFPGERLVIPAGNLVVRSNDCDYPFRPHSAFAHLTGLGTDREPDAVLVLGASPRGGRRTGRS
jgi:Xaa-Pro aminopeptidase